MKFSRHYKVTKYGFHVIGKGVGEVCVLLYVCLYVCMDVCMCIYCLFSFLTFVKNVNLSYDQCCVVAFFLDAVLVRSFKLCMVIT